ncbi:MAG: VWA-like domain-containing protein [Pseudomonadota bacterium]
MVHSYEKNGPNIAILAHTAMIRARAALLLDHPFFGKLALGLQLKPDPYCHDLWTDGRTLGYNPQFAHAVSESALIGAQAHEIMHIACAHHIRREQRDATLWNKACDLVVNQLLLDGKFTLPEGAIHDPQYAGQSVEAIYADLWRWQELESNQGAKNSMVQEESERTEDASGQGGGDVEGQGSSEDSADTSHEDKEALGEAESGRGSAAKERQSDDTKGEKAEKVFFSGEVRDHPVLESAENDADMQRKIEQAADIELVNAMQNAKNMGDIPAGFMRLYKERLRPTLDWRSILQRFLENCMDGDSTWTVPNRRYLYQGIYLPSRQEPRIPHMVLAVDCSGSIDEQLLQAFCAELSAILMSYDTILTVLFHDTKVQGSQTFTRQDLPLRITPQGGGGTDYRPVMDHIMEQGMSPNCLLWFTDLECSRFPQEPNFPVLWLSDRPSTSPVPFGELACLAN